jgi:ribonuclease HI
MAKDKYYVVWQGKDPGVYLTWKECEAQVKGQAGAKFKAFGSRQDAEKAFAEGPQRYMQANARRSPKVPKGELVDFSRFPEIHPLSWCVDAACSGNPGVMEYRGVHTATNQQLFIRKFQEGTNNIGEFLGIVHALALLKKQGDGATPIYSDSKIALNWVLRDKRCKTKLEPNAKNAELFEFVKRAENWLRTNTFSNPLLKWETKKWGEIPADFGRK